VLGEWLDARGHEVETVAVYAGQRPPAVDGYDLVVSLGSEHSAYDDKVPWQADLQRTLRAADEAGVRALGVCFGGQALARALGGEARRAARPELGWLSIGARDGLVADGPWFSWHSDEMVPPPAAEILAANDSGVQLWRLRGHIGLQFHPEASVEIIDGWLESAPEKARARGVDPHELSAETHRRAGDARERAFALFDALLG
jgi:GMP synthase-like glutamine amidotransferase